jgi:hypothetical protein
MDLPPRAKPPSGSRAQKQQPLLAGRDISASRAATRRLSRERAQSAANITRQANLDRAIFFASDAKTPHDYDDRHEFPLDILLEGYEEAVAAACPCEPCGDFDAADLTGDPDTSTVLCPLCRRGYLRSGLPVPGLPESTFCFLCSSCGRRIPQYPDGCPQPPLVASERGCLSSLQTLSEALDGIFALHAATCIAGCSRLQFDVARRSEAALRGWCAASPTHNHLFVLLWRCVSCGAGAALGDEPVRAS